MLMVQAGHVGVCIKACHVVQGAGGWGSKRLDLSTAHAPPKRGHP